jgi:hypothetical protein
LILTARLPSRGYRGKKKEVSKKILSEITLLLPDAVVIAELPDNVEAKLEMSC